MSFRIVITPEMRGRFPGFSDYEIACHYRTVATTQKVEMMTKEHLDQMGISVAPNGSLVIRYINGEGQRVTFDLTAIIEQKVAEGIHAHMEAYHGHSL